MGSLILPQSGAVYLDAQILIYSIEKHPRYAPHLRILWEAFDRRQIELRSSELILLETLVLPMRNHDQQLQKDYERILLNPSFHLTPVTRAVMYEAARLRAEQRNLKTPDAIHAATALLDIPSMMLTNDRAFQSIATLNVTVLDDVVK